MCDGSFMFWDEDHCTFRGQDKHSLSCLNVCHHYCRYIRNHLAGSIPVKHRLGMAIHTTYNTKRKRYGKLLMESDSNSINWAFQEMTCWRFVYWIIRCIAFQFYDFAATGHGYECRRPGAASHEHRERVKLVRGPISMLLKHAQTWFTLEARAIRWEAIHITIVLSLLSPSFPSTRSQLLLFSFLPAFKSNHRFTRAVEMEECQYTLLAFSKRSNTIQSVYPTVFLLSQSENQWLQWPNRLPPLLHLPCFVYGWVHNASRI